MGGEGVAIFFLSHQHTSRLPSCSLSALNPPGQFPSQEVELGNRGEKKGSDNVDKDNNVNKFILERTRLSHRTPQTA
jgi:hypothetical protein